MYDFFFSTFLPEMPSWAKAYLVGGALWCFFLGVLKEDSYRNVFLGISLWPVSLMCTLGAFVRFFVDKTLDRINFRNNRNHW